MQFPLLGAIIKVRNNSAEDKFFDSWKLSILLLVLFFINRRTKFSYFSFEKIFNKKLPKGFYKIQQILNLSWQWRNEFTFCVYLTKCMIRDLAKLISKFYFSYRYHLVATSSVFFMMLSFLVISTLSSAYKGNHMLL